MTGVHITIYTTDAGDRFKVMVIENGKIQDVSDQYDVAACEGGFVVLKKPFNPDGERGLGGVEL